MQKSKVCANVIPNHGIIADIRPESYTQTAQQRGM